jgi:hypothetical protein
MDYADGGDLYTKIANQKKVGKGMIFEFDIYLIYSKLLRRSDIRLVCTNGIGY